MALVLEDGTGLANAESFASVAEATAFFSGRGKADAWDAVEDKEAALRNASDYIQFTYAGRWSGKRLSANQALDWPRVGVYDADSRSYVASNVVPRRVKNACIELALRAAAGELVNDLGRETVSESVDVISVTYAQGGKRQTTYASVDAWLAPLLGGGGSSIAVVRA